MAEQTGATLEYMYLDEHGHLKDGEINKIDEKTKIVAFAHVSNVLGMEFPVKELTEKAHSVGAIVVLDGAQSTPHKKLTYKHWIAISSYFLAIKCVHLKGLVYYTVNVIY